MLLQSHFNTLPKRLTEARWRRRCQNIGEPLFASLKPLTGPHFQRHRISQPVLPTIWPVSGRAQQPARVHQSSPYQRGNFGTLVLVRNGLSEGRMDQNNNNAESLEPQVEPTPADLASRIAQNDRAAETELINRYSKAIRFFLRRRYRDPSLIEDVWQETFCRVIMMLREGKLRTAEALPAFIRTTALNAGREYVRKDAKFHSDKPEDAIVELPSYQPDPLERASDKDLKKLVRDVIDELTVERDRDILIRFYYDNLDKPIICRELELDPTHFDRVLYRARQRLKLKIEHKYGGSPLAGAAISLIFGGMR